jgi:tripartite-type tricarboxylate transporter receptor subunit TctC
MIRRNACGWLFGIVSLGALASGTLAAGASESSDFYKGKLVQVVVGYAAGGGFDAYARLVTPRLSSELGATVVVQNKPGAAGLNALMGLTREPGDGTQMLLLDGEAALLNEVVDPAGRYNLKKVTVLGRISFETRTLVVKKGSPLQTLKGMTEAKRTLYFGAGDRIDAFGAPASILCAALNLQCKLVLGFRGAPDIALAINRGELDAFVTSESQAATLVSSGDHTAVAVMSPVRAALLPDVPTIKEQLSIAPDAYRWIQFRTDIADFGRVFVVPSDTPADRIAFLRTAIETVLKDPALVELGNTTNRPIAYQAPETLVATAKRVTGTMTEADRQDIRRILLEAY